MFSDGMGLLQFVLRDMVMVTIYGPIVLCHFSASRGGLRPGGLSRDLSHIDGDKADGKPGCQCHLPNLTIGL